MIPPRPGGARGVSRRAEGQAPAGGHSPGCLDVAPPLLRFEIARDGRVLLERAPNAWADFRARAMIDWWDWAPTARLFHAAAASRLRAALADGSP